MHILAYFITIVCVGLFRQNTSLFLDVKQLLKILEFPSKQRHQNTTLKTKCHKIKQYFGVSVSKRRRRRETAFKSFTIGKELWVGSMKLQKSRPLCSFSKVRNTEMTRLKNLFLLVKKKYVFPLFQLAKHNQLKTNMFEFNSHNGFLCTLII